MSRKALFCRSFSWSLLVHNLEIGAREDNFAPVMNSKSPEIIELCREIEDVVGRSMHTPADFDFLCDRICTQTREYISSTTLKRTWGYLDGVRTIRYSSLEILARAAGYRNWENYLAVKKISLESDSKFVNRGIVEAGALNKNDIVVVTWNPNRKCVFRYLGNDSFIVTESVKTHLCAGDTASVKTFVVNEPLILSNLTHNGETGLTYVCGANGGLTNLIAYSPK